MNSTVVETSIENGRMLGKLALYFGCFDSLGHFLHDKDGRTIYDHPSDLPWDLSIMDTGLLKNGKIADVCDGKVYYTAGGNQAFWYAFYWWDRSVDKRGNSNSGFFVRGFGWPEAHEAFAFACTQFPRVVKRQPCPLVLQLRGIDQKAVPVEKSQSERAGMQSEAKIK